VKEGNGNYWKGVVGVSDLILHSSLYDGLPLMILSAIGNWIGGWARVIPDG
jgi:hypothetical protein